MVNFLLSDSSLIESDSQGLPPPPTQPNPAQHRGTSPTWKLQVSEVGLSVLCVSVKTIDSLSHAHFFKKKIEMLYKYNTIIINLKVNPVGHHSQTTN